MKLLQAKVRCVQGIVDTNWFEPGRNITIINGNNHSGSQLMRSLEAVNPVQPIDVLRPFSDHPEFRRQGPYKKKVFPGKTTASYMIFEAAPELIRVLGELDPVLYETDRIETGRRLDNSRWYSFVELSESARWSDLAGPLHTLYERYRQTGGGKINEFHGTDRLSPKTRIKGETADLCNYWLDLFTRLADPVSRKLVIQCRDIVQRNLRFKLARRVAGEYMPHTVRISPDLSCKAEYPKGRAAAGDKMIDPVSLLLQELIHRYSSPGDQPGSGRLNDAIVKASRRIITYWPETAHYELPCFEKNKTTFKPPNLPTRAHLYLHTAWVVSLLTLALKEQLPILLFDTARGPIPPEDCHYFFNQLNHISRGAQILLHYYGKMVHPLEGVRRLQIDNDGKISQG